MSHKQFTYTLHNAKNGNIIALGDLHLLSERIMGTWEDGNREVNLAGKIVQVDNKDYLSIGITTRLPRTYVLLPWNADQPEQCVGYQFHPSCLSDLVMDDEHNVLEAQESVARTEVVLHLTE